MTRATGRRAWWLLFALGLVAWVVSAWPERAARPLVEREGWVVEGGFASNARPNAAEVRRSILKSQSTVFWRSWTPEHGAQPGRVATPPFRAVRRMVVPYGGFPGDPGIRLYIECLADGRTLDLALARTNTQWAEALVSLPKRWCSSSVRVVGESTSQGKYLAMGTPFGVDRVSALKSGFLGRMALLLAAFAPLCLIVLAVQRWMERLGAGAWGFAAGCVALGVISHATFFAFHGGNSLGTGFGVTVLVLAGGVLMVCRRGAGPGPDAGLALLWALASLGYGVLLYAADNGGGAWAANARFAPVRWSTDNQLPMLTAAVQVAGAALDTLPFGSWKVSDRPPLMVGAMDMALLGSWLSAGDDGPYRSFLLAQGAGICLNALVVPLSHMLLRRIGLNSTAVAGGTLVVALSPLALFNTVYVWPKLAGGAFSLVAVAILVQSRGWWPGRGQSLEPQLAALCGLALGVSLMCHGGTAFGNLAILGWAFLAGHLRSWRALLGASLAMVALLLPWSLWQSMVQPPGNALVKYAFAGTFGFGEERLGVLETILRAYRGIDFGTWLEMKARALGTVLGVGAQENCGYGEMARGDWNWAGRWRVEDFLHVRATLGVMGVGMVAWLGLATGFLRSRLGNGARPAIGLSALGLAGVLLNALATWDCHIVHHQSYQSLVLLLVGGWLAAVAVSRILGAVLLGLAVLYSGVVWVVEPVVAALHVDAIGGVALGLLLAWLGYVVAGCMGQLVRQDDSGVGGSELVRQSEQGSA